MPIEQISAKLKDGEPVECDFDLDEKLQDAVDRYGEAIVFSRYRAQLIIDLQAYMRSLIKNDKVEDEIKTLVLEWRPGIKAKGKTPAEQAKDLFSKLTAEERADLLAEYNL